MKKKITAAMEREMYFALMGEDVSCGGENEPISKDEALANLNEAFWIYQDMLHRAIEINDQNDAAHIRRQLQEIKVERRRLLAS